METIEHGEDTNRTKSKVAIIQVITKKVVWMKAIQGQEGRGNSQRAEW